MRHAAFVLPFLALTLLAGSASAGTPETAPQPAGPTLAYTTWQLVAIQTGPNQAASPDDPAQLTIAFGGDEAIVVTTTCATVAGTASFDPDSGVTMTLAEPDASTCAARSLEERFLKDVGMASSYIFNDDGNLIFNLPADGGFVQLRQDIAVTKWQWTTFLSMDDSAIVPDDPTKFTLTFQDDGVVAVVADCVSGIGAYAGDGVSQFDLDLTGIDVSGCGEDSLAGNFVRDLDMATSYVFRAGKMYVALPADAGIYEFTAGAPGA